MPEIPAKPGDWLDLYGSLLTLALDPTGKSDGVTGNEPGILGPFIFWSLMVKPEAIADISPEVLEMIGHADPNKFQLGQSAKLLVYGLVTSGHILAYVLRLARYNPKISSVETAVRILEWRYTQESSPSSTTSIKVAWSKYKYLSPYVVGLVSMSDKVVEFAPNMPLFWDTSQDIGRDLKIDPDGMQDYISQLLNKNPVFNQFINTILPPATAMAEKYRIVAEKHFSTGQEARNKPLLDPAETWRLPESFDLPQVEFTLERFDADELEAATVK